MAPNLLYLIIAAIIPLAVGFVWYHDKVFGKSWLSASGLHADVLKTGNMLLIFGLTFVFSFFIAFTMYGMSVHQFGFFQTLEGFEGFPNEGSSVQGYYDDFLAKYGNLHRSFAHGMLHGAVATIGFALPLIAINALFERKSWKYIWINTGYWMVSLVLMGGILCAFA